MSKIIRLTENQFGEMMAYHGSSSDFDKFNHKKYLSTGAGSQSFGWGTYVSNDKVVANGYTDINIDVQSLNKEELVKALCNNNTPFVISEKEAVDFIDRFYKLLNNHNLPLRNGEVDFNLLLGCGFSKNDIYKINIIVDYVNSIGGNKKILYSVDIPDDNGTNYIEWYEYFPPEFMKRILKGFLRIHDKYLDIMAEKNYPFKCDLYQDIQWIKQNPNRGEMMIDMLCKQDNYEDFFSSSYYTHKGNNEGRNVYRRLESIMGSEKAASLFLMQCGFDGIKYEAGTRWGLPNGASEESYNYVIFDANKVKIINKTKV